MKNIILTLIIGLVASCSLFQQRNNMNNHSDTTDIPFIRSLNNENVEYGWIKSDLFGENTISPNKNGVENRKIDIFYFIRKANRANAPYVIFFNGGPGIAVTDLYHSHHYETFLPSYNIIFMDQRGNGLSEKPSKNLQELNYYSAKYICYDADMIRKKIVGDDKKWFVFGQSYGGVVARKYIELYPNKIQVAITHGSAKYSAINVAVNTEINTKKRTDEYFEKYPKDLKIVETLKLNLKKEDYVSSDDYKLSGKAVIDLLYIFYAIYPDEKMHELFNSINQDNLTKSFIDKIKPLAETLLKTGSLASVVGHIDLAEGQTEKQIIPKIKKRLMEKEFVIEQQIFSQMRITDNIEKISVKQQKLDRLLEENFFEPDPTNLKIIASNLSQYDFQFHVYGSHNDALAIDSIHNEENFTKSIEAKNWHYHYSNGNHREWLSNKNLFDEVLSIDFKD